VLGSFIRRSSRSLTQKQCHIYDNKLFSPSKISLIGDRVSTTEAQQFFSIKARTDFFNW
jgi:hypothetical protein